MGAVRGELVRIRGGSRHRRGAKPTQHHGISNAAGLSPPPGDWFFFVGTDEVEGHH